MASVCHCGAGLSSQSCLFQQRSICKGGTLTFPMRVSWLPGHGPFCTASGRSDSHTSGLVCPRSDLKQHGSLFQSPAVPGSARLDLVDDPDLFIAWVEPHHLQGRGEGEAEESSICIVFALPCCTMNLSDLLAFPGGWASGRGSCPLLAQQWPLDEPLHLDEAMGRSHRFLGV